MAKAKNTMIRVGVLLIVGAALVAGAIAYKANERKGRGERLLVEMISELRAVEVDENAHAYIEGMARSFHAEAAGEAFESRGITGGTYDVNRYQRALVDRMIAKAKGDGSTHIAQQLEDFKHSIATLELGDEG